MERTRRWAIAILLVALLLVLGILLPRRDEDETSTPPPAPPILEQAAPVPAVFTPLPLPGQPKPERRRRIRRDPPPVALAPLDPMWSPELTRFQRRLLAGTKLFDKVRATYGEHLDEAALRLGLEEHYFGELDPVESLLRAALVIDLSNGEGDALPLARALARTKHHRGLVGYWDAQRRS